MKPDKTEDQARPEPLPQAPGSVIEVPYHDIPMERDEKVRLVDGQTARFRDGREVSVFRCPDGPGLFFRISKPLEYGKVSMLKFRMSEEAAMALAYLIMQKVSPNTGSSVSGPATGTE